MLRLKFSVAPTRLETGRYEGLVESDRTCFNPACQNSVENKEHVLLECPLYLSERSQLMNKFLSISVDWVNLSNGDKLDKKFSCDKFDAIRECAEICYAVLNDGKNFYSH